MDSQDKGAIYWHKWPQSVVSHPTSDNHSCSIFRYVSSHKLAKGRLPGRNINVG